MATFETHSTFVSRSEPVRVQPLTTIDESDWDRFVRAHPDASFFHQIGWKRVMEKTYGYKPFYLCSKRGNRITGIAPAFLASNWLTGRSLVSVPFAVYGGVCAVDDESEQMLLAHLEKLAVELEVDYLELRYRNKGPLEGYQPNSRYSTFTIPLTPDTDALYKSFPKDIRYMIRKGEKAGLRCVRGVNQIDQFYRLMTLNLRRLGTPAFPRALFDNLASEFSDQMDLTVLYSKDVAIAAGMSFFFRDSMQPYYIGANEDAKTLAANNLLWWELIKIAAISGCATFDFGRSKKESGNFSFKKKWNPRIESLDYQIRLVKRTDLPNYSPNNPKFDLVTTIWKRLPLGLTRALGPRLVRLFP